MTTTLTTKKCLPCEAGVPPLSQAKITELQQQLNKSWELVGTKKLQRQLKFKNYYHTLAFVNAVAFIAHQENHHPDLEVSYNTCKITYTTHAIDGLSENDFICAAKVDKLIPE